MDEIEVRKIVNDEIQETIREIQRSIEKSSVNEEFKHEAHLLVLNFIMPSVARRMEKIKLG